jgi:hypothetical protein
MRGSKVVTMVLAAVALVAGACSKNASVGTGGSSPAASGGAVSAPGVGGTAIGFIFVGPKNDYGYNQAAYDGSQAVAKAYPNLKVLTAENVPEDDNAARVMNDMVGKGAKIIFATSYGHLDPAAKVAAAHPDVVVVQQGNLIKGTVPANMGTYFGTVYEPVFLAGIADPRQHRCLRARRPVRQPGGDDLRRQHLQLVRPRQAGARGKEPPRPGCRRRHPAPGLHRHGHQGHRGRREVHGRLPRRRLPARSERLADGIAVELGTALRRHRQDDPGRQVHRRQVQRQLPGRVQDR